MRGCSGIGFGREKGFDGKGYDGKGFDKGFFGKGYGKGKGKHMYRPKDENVRRINPADAPPASKPRF